MRAVEKTDLVYDDKMEEKLVELERSGTLAGVYVVASGADAPAGSGAPCWRRMRARRPLE